MMSLTIMGVGGRKSEKDCQHLVNKVFPCGRICAELSARDPGNAKNVAWDQHLFQS